MKRAKLKKTHKKQGMKTLNGSQSSRDKVVNEEQHNGILKSSKKTKQPKRFVAHFFAQALTLTTNCEKSSNCVG